MTHYAPKIYRVTQDRRRRAALAAAARQARGKQHAIAEAIEANGERMSDEGRVFLDGLGKAFDGLAKILRG